MCLVIARAPQRAGGVRPDALLNRCASQLQRSAHQVGRKSALVPRADIQLGIGRLRSNLEIGVLHRVADGVNSREESGRKEILSEEVTAARGIQTAPLVITVTGKKVRRIGDG